MAIILAFIFGGIVVPIEIVIPKIIVVTAEITEWVLILVCVESLPTWTIIL